MTNKPTNDEPQCDCEECVRREDLEIKKLLEKQPRIGDHCDDF